MFSPVQTKPSLWAPLKTRNVQFVAGVISILYLFIQAIFLNFGLLVQTLMSDASLWFKLHLSFSLLTGFIVMFPLRELVFMLLTAIFVGLNVALLIAVMQNVKRTGSMRMSIGGMSVLALASSGCPSCGLSLLSLLGPSTGIIGVALHSFTAQVVVLGLLLGSIIYSLKKLQAGFSCRITP